MHSTAPGGRLSNRVCPILVFELRAFWTVADFLRILDGHLPARLWEGAELPLQQGKWDAKSNKHHQKRAGRRTSVVSRALRACDCSRSRTCRDRDASPHSGGGSGRQGIGKGGDLGGEETLRRPMMVSGSRIQGGLASTFPWPYRRRAWITASTTLST